MLELFCSDLVDQVKRSEAMIALIVIIVLSLPSLSQIEGHLRCSHNILILLFHGRVSSGRQFVQ